MEIKILGSGCAGCKALLETTQKVVAEMGIDAQVVKENDMVVIMSYNVMRLPAMVIDGKVVSSGKNLSSKEVTELLSK